MKKLAAFLLVLFGLFVVGCAAPDGSGVMQPASPALSVKHLAGENTIEAADLSAEKYGATQYVVVTGEKKTGVLEECGLKTGRMAIKLSDNGQFATIDPSSFAGQMDGQYCNIASVNLRPATAGEIKNFQVTGLQEVAYVVDGEEQMDNRSPVLKVLDYPIVLLGLGLGGGFLVREGTISASQRVVLDSAKAASVAKKGAKESLRLIYTQGRWEEMITSMLRLGQVTETEAIALRTAGQKSEVAAIAEGMKLGMAGRWSKAVVGQLAETPGAALRLGESNFPMVPRAMGAGEIAMDFPRLGSGFRPVSMTAGNMFNGNQSVFFIQYASGKAAPVEDLARSLSAGDAAGVSRARSNLTEMTVEGGVRRSELPPAIAKPAIGFATPPKAAGKVPDVKKAVSAPLQQVSAATSAKAPAIGFTSAAKAVAPK